jgi:hypothetical protein
MNQCISCPSVSLCFTVMGEQGTCPMYAHVRHELKLIKFTLRRDRFRMFKINDICNKKTEKVSSNNK